MIKAWTDDAWQDFEYWTKQDKKTLNQILKLLKDIDRNGYKGLGKPERLSGDLAPYWSRRIDDTATGLSIELMEMLSESFSAVRIIETSEVRTTGIPPKR